MAVSEEEEEEDGEEVIVREVTSDMLSRIEDEEWDHVNGLYDGANEWRTWDQPIRLVNDFDDSDFLILPYIDIDLPPLLPPPDPPVVEDQEDR